MLRSHTKAPGARQRWIADVHESWYFNEGRSRLRESGGIRALQNLRHIGAQGKAKLNRMLERGIAVKLCQPLTDFAGAYANDGIFMCIVVRITTEDLNANGSFF